MHVVTLSCAILVGAAQRAEAQGDPKKPDPAALKPGEQKNGGVDLPLHLSLEERLQKLDISSGLSCPHTFRGREGLEAFRAFPRPAPNSPEARLEYFFMRVCEAAFDSPKINPGGEKIPPSPLIFGEPSNIVEVIRNFNDAQAKLPWFKDKPQRMEKLSAAANDIEAILKSKTGAALNEALSPRISELIADVGSWLPRVVPNLTTEEAYVLSKLPRVLVHELIRDCDDYLMRACKLTVPVSGVYPPKDAPATLQLIQEAKRHFQGAPQVNYALHRKIIIQLEWLESHWKKHIENPSHDLRGPLVELCNVATPKAEFDRAIKSLSLPPREASFAQDDKPSGGAPAGGAGTAPMGVGADPQKPSAPVVATCEVIEVGHLLRFFASPKNDEELGIAPASENLRRCAVESQLKVIDFLRKNPDAKVVSDMVTTTLSERMYKSFASNGTNQRMVAAKRLFKNGIPASADKLTREQALAIYQFGAAELLWLLGELPSVEAALTEVGESNLGESLKKRIESPVCREGHPEWYAKNGAFIGDLVALIHVVTHPLVRKVMAERELEALRRVKALQEKGAEKVIILYNISGRLTLHEKKFPELKIKTIGMSPDTALFKKTH